MSEPISLSALRAAHEAATPGEWRCESCGQIDYRLLVSDTPIASGIYEPDDAAAIVAEHNATPALLEIAEAALAATDENLLCSSNQRLFDAVKRVAP